MLTNTYIIPIAGKYYLVDSGYANRIGFLAPYRGTNYHLHDRRRLGGDRKKEMFNFRHASLRNAVERTFGIWKSRFRILRGVPRYSLQTQKDIIVACAVLHNFIMMSSDDEVSESSNPDQQDADDIEADGDNIDQDGGPPMEQEEGHQAEMGVVRQGITEMMWAARHRT